MATDADGPTVFKVDLGAARGDLDISAAFCQDFHRRWLLAAATGQAR
jgi:hypothetical protein